MPKLSGVFQLFTNLASANPQSIFRWLDQPISEIILENYLANRLLYPQSIPSTAQEMTIDLALLKEGIATNAKIFFNTSLNQVTIPAGFEARFKPFTALIAAFIDALALQKDTSVVLQGSSGEQQQGQILIPTKIPPRASHQITTSVITDTKIITEHAAGHDISVDGNRISLIPLNVNHLVDIKIDSLNYAKLQVGSLGLIADFRPKNPKP